jgi:septum formation protein
MNPMLPESCQRHLVLASRSPRRYDLMTGMGFEFEVVPASEMAERRARHDDPFELPAVAARLKCEEVSEARPESTVVAADTVVILDGTILNKPADDDQARRFLSALSGQTHTVVTGLAIQNRRSGVDLSASESTRVTFRSLGEDEITSYINTGEGRDKAGSYAAQGLGCSLIRSIDGCFYNVVGLPMYLLYELLRKVG